MGNLIRMRDGDESCNGNAITEGDLARDDGRWDMWIAGGWIWRCARGAVYDCRSRVFQHGGHFALATGLRASSVLAG